MAAHSGASASSASSITGMLSFIVDADRLPLPIVSGDFAPEHVNASDQLHDMSSLFYFVRQLISAYSASPEIGWGEFEILRQPHSSVLAHSVRGERGQLVAMHNFADEPREISVRIDDTESSTRASDVLSETTYEIEPGGILRVTLEGFGFRWIRIARPGDHPVPDRDGGRPGQVRCTAPAGQPEIVQNLHRLTPLPFYV